MRTTAFAAAGLALAAAAPALGETYDAEDLEVRRFIGLIEIRTGGVDAISVEYDDGAGLIDAPEFEVDDDVLEIEQLSRFTRIDCRSRNQGDLSVRIGRGGRYHDLAEYGRLVVHVPAGAQVTVGGGAVSGEIGDTGTLSLGLDSCGSIVAGDVAGDAALAVNGSGDITVGAIGGSLEAAVNGSGDIETGAVGGEVDAAINGSGDITIARVQSTVDAAIRGSGDIEILAGEAPSLDVAIMGSGDVRFDGVARDVDLASFGSGDVEVAEVTGTVETAALGSGRVRIGRH